MYPCPIMTTTQLLLREVGLLNFYEEATSLKGHSGLLGQLIFRWNDHREAFRVSSDQWYAPIEEDTYFITGLSRRGKDFPQFLNAPVDYAARSQLAYSQRYIRDDIISLANFQMSDG